MGRCLHMNINCDSLHLDIGFTLKRIHFPRHDGTANELHLVCRPGKPSPRQRYFDLDDVSSGWITELSTISSADGSFCCASKSQRTVIRSPNVHHIIPPQQNKKEKIKDNNWIQFIIQYEWQRNLISIWSNKKAKKMKWITEKKKKGIRLPY